MKSKWYRSSLVKGGLICLCHAAVVMMSIALAWLSCYPAIVQEVFYGDGAKKFENSAAFQDEVEGYAFHLLNGLFYKSDFETKGMYDPEKIVDISSFCKNDKITGKNESGLAYRLGELVEWGSVLEADGEGRTVELKERVSGYEILDDYEESYDDGSENPSFTNQIIVCEKADGSYHYYLYSDFHAQIENGELKFVMADDSGENGVTSSQLLEMLKNGEWHSDYYEEEGMDDYASSFKGIQDAEGKILYINCWCYDGTRFAERYAPLGKENLLQLVNEDERWNGKLQKAFDYIDTAARTIYEYYTVYVSSGEGLEEGTTNLSYLYTDIANQKVVTNRTDFSGYEKIKNSLEKMKEEGKYIFVRQAQKDLETNMGYANKDGWYEAVMNAFPDIAEMDHGDEFVFAVSVDSSFPVHDSFYNGYSYYNTHIQELRSIFLCAVSGLGIFLMSIIWLAVTAGRSRKDEKLHLMAFDGWKTEIAAALVCTVWGVCFYLGGTAIWWAITRQTQHTEYTKTFGYSVIQSEVLHPDRFMEGAALLGAFTCTMFLIGFLSLVRRIKARTLWKNSLLKSLWKFMVKIFRAAWGIGGSFLRGIYDFVKNFVKHLHSLWKTCISYCAFLIIQWIVMASATGTVDGFFLFLSLLADGVVLVYLVKKTLGTIKLQGGIEKIANGDLNYKIDSKGLFPEQIAMAERINTIGAGLDAAVEKSMKSERLKTDLITNVSHDIKTPLTSIINYVDLLKQENLEDPKIKHYIEVLDEKSQRLKTLTEDVVEASKISSGNIYLEYIHLDFAEIIRQTSGEFAEKFAAKGLKELQTIPSGEIVIRVDSRRTWRILENLYGNAAKYSMPGTRVYTELTATEKEAVFSMKNISEQPLNISADELMERFVRGDVSRSTEGSGLGLSIAQTLTRMQGGKFELYLDGDLFKVMVIFPKV